MNRTLHIATAAALVLLAAGGDSLRDDGSGYRWGDLNPINNGATLGLFGGAEPTPPSAVALDNNWGVVSDIVVQEGTGRVFVIGPSIAGTRSAKASSSSRPPFKAT